MKRDFDPDEALETLATNRRVYIDKVLRCIHTSIEQCDNYEMASNYMIAAAENLKELNSAMDYLNELTSSDTYPSFGTIFE